MLFLQKNERMLEISYLRENKKEALKLLSGRNIDVEKTINDVLLADDERKILQNERDNILAESNKLSKQIGILLKEKKQLEGEKLKKQTTSLKQEAKGLEEKLSANKTHLKKLLSDIPNIPHAEVPIGMESKDNKIVSSYGDINKIPDKLKPHWDLAIEYDIIDLELGSKITGAGFPVYKGQGAKLQRALINFFLDNAVNEGYLEIEPPILVNEDSAFGTGQLPDKEGQMYMINSDKLYLIPTAEVPLTNLYRDVILNESDFPVKLTAYTPCFRREAGSYGKDVRGLNRVHQFDKVEIVQIQHPDRSYETLEEMNKYVGGLLKQLELPFRIVILCTGDLTFASSFTYDMEVYSGAQKRWLEVSSISNFESFQANRMHLRYKDSSAQKTRLCHTLNGSALALPRIVAALIENNQTADGILIPEILRSYTGFDKIIKK